MSNFTTIEVVLNDYVLEVRLNRPEVHNAVNLAMSQELLEVINHFDSDPQQRVLLVTAAGDRSFCSGVDISDVRNQSTSEETRGYDTFRPWVEALQKTAKPVVVAVNGNCVGGGWHFLADGDIIIGSPNARIIDTHVNVGLVNAVESAGLASKLPRGILMRLVLEGKSFSLNADDAYRWGLFSEVVELPLLRGRAMEIARNVANFGSPSAVRASKLAIRAACDGPLIESLPNAWDALDAVQMLEDTHEALRAFKERRVPIFKDR